MPYELAKQLKEAGFPQEGDLNNYVTCHSYEDDVNCREDGHSAYSPTLEELIDACGDEITSMYRADKLPEGRVWVVKCCDRETHVGIGVTLTIAVARLYLDLNPPNQETK